jgi:hypothetical protein
MRIVQLQMFVYRKKQLTLGPKEDARAPRRTEFTGRRGSGSPRDTHSLSVFGSVCVSVDGSQRVDN